MSDPQAPTPPPAACQLLQQQIDDLSSEIEDLSQSLNEFPPSLRATILRTVARMRAGLRALQAQYRSCVANPAAFALRVDGIEATQSVQSMHADVPLVANKTTVVRVYVTWLMPTTISISGNLRAGSATIASANVVTPQGPNVVPLNDRRNDAAQSLNFILPAAQTAVGSINLSLISAIETGNHTVHHPGNTLSVAATFQQMPPLRIRLLGMRYAAVPSNAPPGSPAQSFVPSNFDFSMIVSWLRRAYPVASVISSQVIVDSNNNPPFDCNQVNAQVAAIRMQDMQAGGDPFTHYFGLVGDGNGLGFWMRGCSGIPAMADPSAVGSGPTGNGNWGWDNDGCYGDWYTAHELGHTFGRLHPGSGCGESADDHNYPFPAGQLSGADDAYVGFDTGDSGLNLPMAAYPGTSWHDVMTYCVRQWLSSYTYQGIRDRIIAESQLSFGASGAGAPDRRYPSSAARATAAADERPGFVHVVATVNETKGTARLEYMTPVAAGFESRLDPHSRVAVRLLDGTGTPLSEHAVALKPSSCTLAGGDKQALLDVTLPLPAEAAQLDLLVDGAVVDSRKAAATAPRAAALTARRDAAAHEFNWDSGGSSQDGHTYTIQISADNGATWTTLATGVKTPRYRLDHDQVPGQSRVLLRVVATDGFRSSIVRSDAIDLT